MAYLSYAPRVGCTRSPPRPMCPAHQGFALNRNLECTERERYPELRRVMASRTAIDKTHATAARRAAQARVAALRSHDKGGVSPKTEDLLQEAQRSARWSFLAEKSDAARLEAARFRGNDDEAARLCVSACYNVLIGSVAGGLPLWTPPTSCFIPHLKPVQICCTQWIKSATARDARAVHFPATRALGNFCLLLHLEISDMTKIAKTRASWRSGLGALQL